MKTIPTFKQFLNEKAYRLTGIYASKGLIGKVMQAFKKQIEKIQHEGDVTGTLIEVNKAWKKFQKTAEKIIMDQVEKGAKSLDSVLYVTANFSDEWIADDLNGLNSDDGSGPLYIAYSDSGEMVINVGFNDDVNGRKLFKKIDKTGMMNSPITSKSELIYGDLDTRVGENNLEIRDSEYIQIDGK
jgi:hypothetical protein